MTLRYLLDTNIVSVPFRKNPPQTLLERLASTATESAIPSIVWHELRYGWARLPESGRKHALERYLKEVIRKTYPVLDYNGPAAEWHASERSRLEQAGRITGQSDGQIAAIAVSRGLVLVTNNTRDFAHFSGLTVVDWLADL